MIEREMLERMFADMHDHGIGTDEDLLWGYFFADQDVAKLEAVVPTLIEMGYRFVDLFKDEGEADDSEPWFFLHVEKVETHTVDSLHARNQEFYAFVDQHGIESYDGMDVGRADGAPFKGDSVEQAS